jgi:dienelactone hydrolase
MSAFVADPPSALTPLLTDARGGAITTRDAWAARRAQLDLAWRQRLGEFDVRREAAPKVRVLDEDRVGDVVRQHVRYDVERGVASEAYLLRPRGAQRQRPGVVVFHSTVDHSIRQPAGLEGVPEKHFGLLLARRGFVALCPRNFLWPTNDRLAAQDEMRRLRTRHPQAHGMARMLHDGQVALDVLAAQRDVDAARLACIGHSLGAKEALYLAAFDTRVRATVSSEGGIGTAFSNWDAEWYLGDGVAALPPGCDQHELLALAAPRPFLLVGGDSADGAASWPYVAAAMDVYRLYGEPVPLGFLNHHAGHAVPPSVVPRLLDWLETYT